MDFSLYIHFPWCIRKCPYCDFNSHEFKNSFPEEAYISALIRDFENEFSRVSSNKVKSIFMGGGTPSLFSPRSFDNLLNFIFSKILFDKKIEITMEANPGTVELKKFSDFRKIGINRLSLGIQSFQDEKLKLLGRIHNSSEAKTAIKAAQQAGFENFNLDLMHGLPLQTAKEALADIQTALQFQPPHFSWYQLTLEKNTYFNRYPPTLPEEETLFQIQEEGHALLTSAGFQHYEVSAYSKPEKQCQHNLNYWEFGDYMGIGAGAHGKSGLERYWKYRQPPIYLKQKENFRAETQFIDSKNRAFEFMLNALRLKKPLDETLLKDRTGLDFAILNKPLMQAQRQGLIERRGNQIQVTPKGFLFLNDLVIYFMNGNHSRQ